MYILLLVIIYIAFISLGLPDSLLGAAGPTIRNDFGVPLFYVGFFFVLLLVMIDKTEKAVEGD